MRRLCMRKSVDCPGRQRPVRRWVVEGVTRIEGGTDAVYASLSMHAKLVRVYRSLGITGKLRAAARLATWSSGRCGVRRMQQGRGLR